jgi:ubiquinone/menaquinone biosynthesis C-methylase UbiE
MPHVCPWWGGYFIDNRFRRLLHKPEAILAPYVQPGMTGLDFGCGMGFFAISIAQLVGDEGRVIAVDLQPKMLDTLRKRACKADVGDRIDTHRCETDALGSVDPVDFALAFYSVHEVPNERRLLEEIFECLREGACFLVVEPIIHVTAKHFESMVSLSRDVGFTVEDGPRIRLSRAVLLAKPDS